MNGAMKRFRKRRFDSQWIKEAAPKEWREKGLEEVWRSRKTGNIHCEFRGRTYDPEKGTYVTVPGAVVHLEVGTMKELEIFMARAGEAVGMEDVVGRKKPMAREFFSEE